MDRKDKETNIKKAKNRGEYEMVKYAYQNIINRLDTIRYISGEENVKKIVTKMIEEFEERLKEENSLEASAKD